MSWTPTAVATGYVVNATAANGHRVWCSATGATCTLTDLLCSETYTTTIVARGSRCDGVPGSSTNITTGECGRDCQTQSFFCFLVNSRLYMLFIVLSFQPPVLQRSYPRNTGAVPARRWSGGATPREASAFWLRWREEEEDTWIPARLQTPVASSKTCLVALISI